MADTQTLSLAAQTTPADYVLAATQQLTLGAIHAHFDGSGAGGSYVPTLDIISDSGHTVLSVPQDTTIAAGSNAESSWAPFLKTVAAGAGPGPTKIVVSRLMGVSGVQSIPSGVVTKVKQSSFTQTSTTMWTMPGAGNPMGITYTRPFAGNAFFFWANFDWASFAGDRYAEVVFSSVATFGGDFRSRDRASGTPTGDTQFASGFIVDEDNAVGTIDIQVFQASGVNQNLNTCSFGFACPNDWGLN